MRTAVYFIAAAALSAAWQVQLSGCLFGGGGECDCPETPAQPMPRGTLPVRSFTAYDDHGNHDTLPFEAENAQVDLTSDTLTITYQRAGMQHEVVYDVLGPH